MAATCHLGRERGVGNGGERTEGGRGGGLGVVLEIRDAGLRWQP